MTIQKAIEISEAKIQFVSLVDKAANKRQFLITKSDDNRAQFATLGRILKVDTDTHYVTGIVYEPLVEDSQGNFMTEDEIRKAAYWFAKNGDKVDVQHSFEPVDGVTVVENYIAPCDMEIGGVAITKGTWIMTAEVENPEVWDKVQKGEVTGFSMGGVGQYSEIETELPEAVEKDGLFKKLAKLFSYDTVQKGEVADKFAAQAKNSNFWNAWYALEETLRRYDWYDDKVKYLEDEGQIKEALAEFSEIMTALLTESRIMKALAESYPKEIKKEVPEVNKEEIQAQIDESIKKAFEQAERPKPNEDTSEPLTAESVQKMVAEAIKKALEPEAEPLTPESVQQMITDAVAKAVEPVLKARGLPSNLDGASSNDKPVEKHYLAGVF